MAKVHKLEGEVGVKCEASKIFEMQRDKTPNIAQLCSHKIAGVEAHQGDWLSVGTTRKWDYVIDGKSSYLVDKIEEIDDENMIMTRQVIEGDVMSHYNTLKVHSQAISKGNNNSIVKCTLEYEKRTEDAPEPKELLDFGLGVMKELGDHLASAN